jgi:hypothetical protein
LAKPVSTSAFELRKIAQRDFGASVISIPLSAARYTAGRKKMTDEPNRYAA